MNGAPGRKTRPTSVNTSTGLTRYCTDTVSIAPSNCASANGSRGSRLTSWTTTAVNAGLSSISARFKPSPVTAAG